MFSVFKQAQWPTRDILLGTFDFEQDALRYINALLSENKEQQSYMLLFVDDKTGAGRYKIFQGAVKNG